jgi:hypothetical protein
VLRSSGRCGRHASHRVEPTVRHHHDVIVLTLQGHVPLARQDRRMTPNTVDQASERHDIGSRRLACEVDRDPHGPASLEDSVPCSPVGATEHVGPVVRRPHERPKDGPDGWSFADVLPPAAKARRPREGAVEEPSALRHPDRLPLGRRPQTRAPDEPRQLTPVPRGVGHRREALLPPVERRRWRSGHDHAGEGDRERTPHERLRRNRTSTT